MSHADPGFHQRLNNVTRRHRAMSRGVGYRLTADGLIVAHPRRRVPRFPVMGVVLVLAFGLVFKAALVAGLGTAAYGERMEALAGGNVVEQGVAIVMQRDPATDWLAAVLRATVF